MPPPCDHDKGTAKAGYKLIEILHLSHRQTFRINITEYYYVIFKEIFFVLRKLLDIRRSFLPRKSRIALNKQGFHLNAPVARERRLQVAIVPAWRLFYKKNPYFIIDDP